MARFHHHLRKAASGIFALLVTFLGFNMAYSQEDKYGAPSADYLINGKITDATTKKEIPGIKVSCEYNVVFSDSNGNYQINMSGSPWSKNFELIFEDADGAKNGSYSEKKITIDFDDPAFANGDGEWYAGEARKLLNVALKPKE
jgi:putative lipoprotein (rSAM/lipoprotein system)